MPRTVRFHLDENVSRAIALGLRKSGIDVTTTPEVDLLEAPDEEQLAYGLRAGRVIFTQDRDFLRLHAAGSPHLGIAYCQKDTLSIGRIIEGLVLIWEIYESEDMANHVEYL
jgi:predicted nuclease of predicted toxin-antitoxin system